ncbi:GNAT family N-acetyltransferase [Candidatus Bathyarchaeota archaeon]|nr:GNAT family N-acetyltransferase [Candidatus Bathyarchaeota archaeon]
MITIKKVSWRELEKIHCFLKKSWLDFPDPYFRVISKIDNAKIFTRLVKVLLLNWLQKLLADYSTEMWIAEKDGNMVGISYVEIRRKRAILHGIYVIKDFRGKGIGKLLLQSVIRFCLEKDVHTFGLFVSRSNTIAINLFTKNGFKTVAIRNNIAYMELVLN